MLVVKKIRKIFFGAKENSGNFFPDDPNQQEDRFQITIPGDKPVSFRILRRDRFGGLYRAIGGRFLR